MRRPTILVTRPAPDGAATAKALERATGLTVVRSPLVDIAPTGGLPDMTGIARLIFTSRNGVRAYQALNGPTLPAICIGTATAEAARDAGHEAEVWGQDADSLVAALTAAPPPGPLLHIHGEVTRGDVAARLSAAGIATAEAVLYRQTLLDLTETARNLLADRRPIIVPLYSPRTAARFAQVVTPRAPLHVVAMSSSVLRAANALSAENKIVADSPDAPAMIRAVLATVRRVEGMERPH